MIFRLFSKIEFEVSDPIALIECFCFQTNFYSSYDLLLPNRNIEDVAKIGARIDRTKLQSCKSIIDNSRSLPIFRCNLDDFLDKGHKTIHDHVAEASKVVNELMDQGTGLSQALKILHTVYPAIIPMIDSMLQEQYQVHINPRWIQTNPEQILYDYYVNLKERLNRKNLADVSNALNLPCLTKIRVFDIIWWSYLRSERIRGKNEKINWHTIKTKFS